jgi:hypothetical protein
MQTQAGMNDRLVGLFIVARREEFAFDFAPLTSNKRSARDLVRLLLLMLRSDLPRFGVWENR